MPVNEENIRNTSYKSDTAENDSRNDRVTSENVEKS